MKKFNSDWLACAAIFLAGFILYYKSLFYDLTYLDDNVWLKDYSWYLKDRSNLFKVFAKPDVLFGGLFYRPMIYFSFILDTMIKSDSYVIYHFTNIFLHCLNGYLVYAILKKLDYKQGLAWGSALFFTVHPVLTQAVVWIPGRTDSLLALNVFVSFLSFVYFVSNKNPVAGLIHIVFLGLALLTKETAVALPVACLAFLIFYVKPRPSKKFHMACCLTWVAMIVGYFYIRQSILVEKSEISLSFAIDSVWGNLPAIIGYVGKIFLPVNLSVLPVLKDINLLYGWMGMVLLAVAIAWPNKKDYSKIFFALIWFVIFILPSLVGSFLKHEYRVYIPLFGMIILILELNVLQNCWQRFRRLTVGSTIVLFLLMFIQTWTYSQNYQSHYPFWENAVKTSPHSPLAHRNLGAMYFLDKEYDKAEQQFLAALKLNPKESMVYNNLGLIYEHKGKLRQAETAYLKEIVNNPNYDTAYYNLGLFYGKQKKYEKAVQMWETTTKINPRHLMAHKYLAVYFTKTRQMDKSEFHVKELQKRGVVIPQDIDQLLRRK